MIGFRGLFFFAAALLFGTACGSDFNWGKKVSCFMVDDSVVCPGCNYRAGHICPRSLQNSQNCLTSTTTWPTYKKYTTPKPIETTYEDYDFTEETLTTFNLTTPESVEIQKEPTKTSVDMTLFLYRILGSKLPRFRYKRELIQEEEILEPEVCNWTGDCPCPLLCCNTGPGCPKRCVMGIRWSPQNG